MSCPTKSWPTNTAFASTGLIVGLLALSTSFAPAERATAPRVIKCEGLFGRDASHADLVKAFGSSNVVYQEIDGHAEGEKINATVLYPNNAKAKLEIIWGDEKARRQPTVRARDQSTWASANGIRTGMPIADVEKINGRPFTLSGFDLDFGGRVKDWQGGQLAKPLPGGCIIGVEFVHPEDAPEVNLSKVSGDGDFRSDNVDMRAVEPYVAALTISYPQR
jgi:hypothetical protein